MRSFAVRGLAGFQSVLVLLAGTALAYGEEPELAMKGYCPVSIITLKRPVLGGASFRSVYQGFTYTLADAETKAKFDADPGKWVPQFGGFCTTALGGSYGNRLSADPAVFRVRDGKLYLFSSERAVRSFDPDPERYISQATERFNKPALGGNCLVAYVTQGKPVAGDAKYADQYAGVVYHFADEAAREAFRKDPNKYLPAYGGFCVDGIANEKRFPGDPKVFTMYQDQLFFFFDEAAKKRFEANPKEMIDKANAQWPALRKAKPTP